MLINTGKVETMKKCTHRVYASVKNQAINHVIIGRSGYLDSTLNSNRLCDLYDAMRYMKLQWNRRPPWRECHTRIILAYWKSDEKKTKGKQVTRIQIKKNLTSSRLKWSLTQYSRVPLRIVNNCEVKERESRVTRTVYSNILASIAHRDIAPPSCYVTRSRVLGANDMLGWSATRHVMCDVAILGW